MSNSAKRSAQQELTDEQRDAVAFVLELGDAFLRAGYPVNLIGDLLRALARRLALPQPQIYVTPTAIEVAVGPLNHQEGARLVTRPGGIDLGQLTRLDAMASAVAAGTLSPRQATAQLHALAKARPTPGALLIVLSHALAAAAFARTLGGGTREIAVAGLVGALTGVLALVARFLPQVDGVFPPLASFVVSFLAAAVAARVHPLASDLVILAGLVVELPGFTLTVALQELATRDLVSGTVRLTSALITFLGLILGVALGSQLAGRLFGPPHIIPPASLPAWTYLLAILAAGLSYVVRLQVERRDAAWVVFACLIATLSARAGVVALGPQLGAFAAALLVGLASNLLATLRRRPVAVMQVPGLILLVPGSIGFQSFQALFTAQTLAGVQAAFQMFVTAIALVYGIFLANLLLPARGSLRVFEHALAAGGTLASRYRELVRIRR